MSRSDPHQLVTIVEQANAPDRIPPELVQFLQLDMAVECLQAHMLQTLLDGAATLNRRWIHGYQSALVRNFTCGAVVARQLMNWLDANKLNDPALTYEQAVALCRPLIAPRFALKLHEPHKDNLPLSLAGRTIPMLMPARGWWANCPKLTDGGKLAVLDDLPEQPKIVNVTFVQTNFLMDPRRGSPIERLGGTIAWCAANVDPFFTLMLARTEEIISTCLPKWSLDGGEHTLRALLIDGELRIADPIGDLPNDARYLVPTLVE